METNYKKQVIVHIEDKHIVDGEPSYSELTTTGELEGCGEAYSLRYTETDEELRECVTTLAVEGDMRITMTREGPYTTHMVLERDKRHHVFYETPYGSIQMGIFAKAIQSSMQMDGGQLSFRYTIDYSSGSLSFNELTLTVREAGMGKVLS